MIASQAKPGRGLFSSFFVIVACLIGMTIAPVRAAVTEDFTEWDGVDIGDPGIQSSVLVKTNALQIKAAGTDIGGSRDQFFLLSRAQEGDFDIKVRVAALDNVDVWARAGLMAREDLGEGSRFAATLTTPSLSGSTFQSRASGNGAALASGSFPANVPFAWLRLRRSGDRFSGFASVDGGHWQMLGAAELSLSNAVHLGLAVSSHQSNRVTTVEFEEYGPTSGIATNLLSLPREALGPSTRRTGLVISEIMYRSRPENGESGMEFVELFNSNPFFEDISGYQLAGDISFTFPPGTILAGGGFLVVARNPAALQPIDGSAQVLGPYGGALVQKGTVRLLSQSGGVLLEVPYSNKAPWPVAADGTGHSMVLARPSYGESNPAAWSHSRVKGGSPGRVDAMPFGPLEQVVFNEVLASSSDASGGYLELFNYSNEPVDISGCGLSDRLGAVPYRFPSGTVLAARGFLALGESELGFGLSSNGETLYLTNPDDKRVITACEYGAQWRGIAVGRRPDGAGDFYPLTIATRGAANRERQLPDVVINEIMYHPISELDDDEYVELLNRSGQTADLSGWRFTDGIDFEFPNGTQVAPGGYVVVARNLAHLRSRYPNLTPGLWVGNYAGGLSNQGERLALARPAPTTNEDGTAGKPNYVVVDEVTYGTGGRWGQWSDGGGSSLERIDPNAESRRPGNWRDSDETRKSGWVTVERTGVLDNGSGNADAMQVMLLGAGECLVDDVLVSPQSSSTNLLANPDFNAGLTSWSPYGDHVRSSLDEGAGPDGSPCLHLRASNQGDTLVNHVRAALRQANRLPTGSTATLRARVRWLCGLPEMILRLRGNELEAFGRLPVPTNLGTPGTRNSRAQDNPGPILYDVAHLPALPAIDEPAFVTARVADPRQVKRVVLQYRMDPSTNLVKVEMTDDGTLGDAIAGDGIFSAQIPAPNSAALAAFSLEATGMSSPSAISRFPAEAPQRECLVRFGEVLPASGFGTYRLWFTAATVRTWTGRPVLSNEELDGTFVYGNQRVVYNIGARFSGSPWHQGVYNSPVSGLTTYAFSLPKDDAVLGTDSFNKLHALGNTPGDDATLQAEQTAYWMVRQLNLPWNYQRYVQVYVNGIRRGPLMEDTQVPAADTLREYFSDDSDGQLYKLNGWYEPSSAGGHTVQFGLASWCTLNDFRTTGGERKIERFRWNWAPRAVGSTANDYTNVFALVDAANTPQDAPFEENLNGIADMGQWLRTFAIEHAVGNWDSFGNRNAQNMYAYKPARNRWNLLIWDFNIVLGNSGSDGPANDNLFQYNVADRGMRKIYSSPTFVRTYLGNLQDIIEGPMASGRVDPILDARYAAFRASSVSATSPNGLKSWINRRRGFLQNYLTNFATDFAITSPSNSQASVEQNWIVLTGRAPLKARDIRINDVSYPIVWTSLIDWSMTVPLGAGTNHLSVQAFDSTGRMLTNSSAAIEVASPTTPGERPEDHLVINEILHHPLVPGAEFVELLNTSEQSVFDLAGFRLSGVDFEFPPGSLIGPKEYWTLTANRSAFIVAYGNQISSQGQFNGVLDPAGETLRLIAVDRSSGAETIIDEVSYGTAAPWPLEANEPGVALQLVDAAADNGRVGNWGAVGFEAVAKPQWQFVSVTGQAGTNRLLVYHSPLQPAFDPLDIAGQWDGTIQFPGQPYQMTVLFERSVSNSLSGQFLGSDTSAPLVVRVTGGTNVTFSFPPEYGPVTWQGRLSADGLMISGTFSQPGQGGTFTASFSMRRYTEERGGEVYIDDLELVAGAVPGAGPNLIPDGGFEAPLRSDWTVASNHLDTTVSTLEKHSGNSSLHLIADRGGADVGTAMSRQVDGLVPGQIYTLSYWYLPTEKARELTVRMADGSLLSNHRVRPGKTATPGAPNSITAPAEPLPNLVLSEIQVDNVSGLADQLGHREAWVEIFNNGGTTVSLKECYLSNDPENLALWAFPESAVINPNQWLLVWLDAAPAETSAAEWHAGFRPATSGGSILLAKRQSGAPRIVDALNYPRLAANQSYGMVIDGDGRHSVRLLPQATPGAANSAQIISKVVINEWMASNTRTVLESASGQFEDWFELYNPSSQSVDLTGYHATDNLSNPQKWALPAGTKIEPWGFLVIWADERTELNGQTGTEFHANFKLSQAGEVIALADATGAIVDSVTFGPQESDISQGRWPDGAALPFPEMRHATPGASNRQEVPEPAAIRITGIASSPAGGLIVSWFGDPGRKYQLQYKRTLADSEWLNLGEPVAATSASPATTDPDPATMPQKFYRVLTTD